MTRPAGARLPATGLLVSGAVVLVLLGLALRWRRDDRAGSPGRPHERTTPAPDSSASAPAAPPQGSLRAPETARPAPEESLAATFVALQDRVDRLAQRLERELRALAPDRRLSRLLEILDAAADPEAPGFPDARLARVLAARYLAWVAHEDPSSRPAVFETLKTRLRAERDPEVRGQFLALLSGLPTRANAALLHRDRAADVRVFGFVPEPDGVAPPPWLGSLKAAASSDPAVSELLLALASDPRERQRRLALRVLLDVADVPTALDLVERGRHDRFLRLHAADRLARRGEPEVLRALAVELGRETDPVARDALARSLASTPSPPEGVGRILLDAFRGAAGEEHRRLSLATTALTVFAATQEAAAASCVAEALAQGPPPLRESLLRACASRGSAALAPLVRERLLAPADEYERVLAGHALRRIDPAYREPNLLTDLEDARARLDSGSAPPAEEASLRARIDALEARLEALRSGR